MITGQIKNQIDQIWNIFWESAGITNPMTVLEQMTYLFFIKMLDDAQMQREAVDAQLDMPHASDDTYASNCQTPATYPLQIMQIMPSAPHNSRQRFGDMRGIA